MSLPTSRSEWPEDARAEFEERAAIVEHHGELSKAKAEKLAEWRVRRRWGDR